MVINTTEINQGIFNKVIGIELPITIILEPFNPVQIASSLLNHAIKYNIRDYTNAVGNEYFSLGKYQCTLNFWSQECATQMSLGFLAALFSTPIKAFFLSKNSNGRINYNEALIVVFTEQALYETAGKFKYLDSETSGVIESSIGIEVAVSLLSGGTYGEGYSAGTAVYSSILGPYEVLENYFKNNADNKKDDISYTCDNPLYGLETDLCLNQCFDIG